MLRVAWKDLMARKRRLVTTSIAVIIGVAFLTGTQLLSSTLSQSIKDLIGDVYDGIDVVVRSPDAQETGFGDIRNPVPSSLVAEVAAQDGVDEAAGLVEATGPNLLDERGKVVGGGIGPPTLTYNWLDDDRLRPGVLTDGRAPRAPDEVVLDFDSARDVGAGVGDTISIATTQQGTEQFRLVGLAGLGEDGTSSSGARPMLFTTPTAQRLVNQPDQYNLVVVAAGDGTSQEDLARSLADALPEWQVLTGEAFTEESQEVIASFVDVLGRFVTIFGVIALVVATFIIYNTFSIIVAQRTRETALLRAVGARRRQVLGATMLEAAIIGLIASVVGLLGGVGLAAGLTALVGQLFTVSNTVPAITGGIVALALAVGVGITVLSGLAPAVRSSSIPPIAALQEVSLDRSDVSLPRKLWGVAVLVLGIALIATGLADVGPNPLLEVGAGLLLVLASVAVVLGPLIAAPVSRLLALPFAAGGRITGRLAGENAARNPRRTSSTAAALTIGVTLVSVIAILASSIKATADDSIASQFRADLVLTTSTFTFGAGIPDGTEAQVEALPDVALASPVRFTFFTLLDRPPDPDAATTTLPAGVLGQADTAPEGDQTTALGIEPDSWFEVVDSGDLQGEPADLVDGTMAVSRDIAEDRGWSIGDEVPVFFATTGRQQLRVAMVFERTFGQSSIYLPMDTFAANSPAFLNVDNQIYVTARDGADLDALREQLDEIVADSPTTQVQDLTEFTQTQLGFFDTFLAIVYGLLGLAILIALIGIANTLSLSILERTRELGLLRAVGMSRRQVRAVVRLEAAIIAVFGTLIGLVIGILFSIALTVALAADNPDLIRYQLPVGQLAAITVGAALAGVLAAWLPSRRAARLDVLAAISTE